MFFQTVTTATITSANVGCPSQLIGPMPTTPSIWFRSPASDPRKARHTAPTKTMDAMTGMNSVERTTEPDSPRKRRATAVAMPIEMIVCTGTTITV